MGKVRKKRMGYWKGLVKGNEEGKCKVKTTPHGTAPVLRC